VWRGLPPNSLTLSEAISDADANPGSRIDFSSSVFMPGNDTCSLTGTLSLITANAGARFFRNHALTNRKLPRAAAARSAMRGKKEKLRGSGAKSREEPLEERI
jgi:hypothetical protein